MNHLSSTPSRRHTWSAVLLKGLAAGALVLSLSGCLPIPIIEFSPSSPEAGEEVSFDGAGTIVSNIPENTVAVSYRWTFGDGTKASGATPTHTYEKAGTYDVTLTVIDSAGRVGESQETVTVGEAVTTTTSDTSVTDTSTSTSTDTTSGSTDSTGTLTTATPK
jgi:PKD repeat protein